MFRPRMAGAVSALALTLACRDAVAPLPAPPLGDPSLVIAYTALSATDCTIVLATVDGRARPLPSVCGIQVAWSPDGHRLAFSKEGGEAAPPSLWIVNADGTGEIAVPGGVGLADPGWSPDGTRLATDAPGSGTFVVLRPDGSGRVVLSATYGVASFDRPSWSPDGATLLFARFDTLWAVDLVSGAAHVLFIPGVPRICCPRWAPDGRRLSFNGPEGAYVVNADGSGLRRLIADRVEGGAAWSGDGQQLVYGAARGDGSTVDVFRISSDGTRSAQNLTHNGTGKASILPDWALAR